VEHAIDSFIRFLAVERGLSENYQLSTQRSLTEFAIWRAKARSSVTRLTLFHFRASNAICPKH
jgi:site-specific recombinase XerD